MTLITDSQFYSPDVTENGRIAPNNYRDWKNPGYDEEDEDEHTSRQVIRQVVKTASR